MFKFTKPNLHDLIALGVVFVTSVGAYLSTSASINKTVLYSAVLAGLGAVVHNYLTPTKE